MCEKEDGTGTRAAACRNHILFNGLLMLGPNELQPAAYHVRSWARRSSGRQSRCQTGQIVRRIEKPSFKRNQPSSVVKKGKAVTGTMFEVSWDVNKNELSAEFGKCFLQRTGMFFRFFMWSKAVMLKLSVQETKMSDTNMTFSMWSEGETNNKTHLVHIDCEEQIVVFPCKNASPQVEPRIVSSGHGWRGSRVILRAHIKNLPAKVVMRSVSLRGSIKLMTTDGTMKAHIVPEKSADRDEPARQATFPQNSQII